MSAKVPIIKQVAWISAVPQLMVMGVIILVWYQFEKTRFVLYGALTYLLISQVLRRTISKDHRGGMHKVKQQQFDSAIPYFIRSYDFFKANDWLDKYRYLTLLSSTKMTYKEMALNNIAFCYGQIGNGDMAKAYYQRALDEFPESGLARAGLNLLEAMTSDGEAEST